MYEEYKEKEYVIEIKGFFKNGLYQRHAIDTINLEEFKKLILKNDGSFNKENIQLIHPSKDLTLEELEEIGVLEIDDESLDYEISNDYQYLENGFEFYPEDEWEFLRPMSSTSNPPKNYNLDIIVHSKPGLPGILGDQGHASVKITTPGGEIYSIGLFPKDLERESDDLSLQNGKLTSPDSYMFLPSHSVEQHQMSYTLPDQHAFHKLVKWIEAMQGYHKDDEDVVTTTNLFYHPTHQSCAAFASELRDYAINDLGAKSNQLNSGRITPLNKIFIRFKEAILNFLITCPLGKIKTKFDKGVDFGGIENFNIIKLNPNGMFLPIDLLIRE